ncbi:MAG: ABC transporter permease [Bacteroidales bacterium]|nr:ABC transporter permease [Bacteroidales bacterium]
MWASYLRITAKNLTKNRTYTLLNMAGLAIGMASFIIIYSYISDELSYDRHHTCSERIYRLVNVYDYEGVGENSASSPFPVAFTMAGQYPDMIGNVVRLFNFQAPRSFIEYGEKRFNERRFFFADSTYFDIFDHEFVSGDPDHALDEVNSVVITESAARKYFDGEPAMGKVIRFESRISFRITGVIRDVREQSHFHFDFLASMSSVRPIYGGRLPGTWVWNPCWTYFLLKENVEPSQLEALFPDFIKNNFDDADKDHISLYLQPLTDIHLRSHLDYEIQPNGNIRSVFILSAVAAFLLIISVINFMNLATATSSIRAREVGIKKVVGAHRLQLMVQFIIESVILSFLALILALILVEFTLPAFNSFAGKELRFSALFEWRNILMLLLIGLLTGFIAGVYPAFYMSAFRPVEALSGSVRQGIRSGLPRKILVILQFSISIFMIIGTITIHRQLHYLRNADLGFHKEDIIILPVLNTPVASVYPAFRKELMQCPAVFSVTAMDDIFGVSHNTHEFRPEGYPEDKWSFFPALVVRYDFVKTFGIDIIAGRDYREENKTDPMKGMLINESMVKYLGWNTPEEAIGKKLKSLNGDERVIGVFRDFHPTSLHETSGPFVINMKELPGEVIWFLKFVAVRIHPGTESQALAFLEEEWKKIAPGRPFEYFFLKDELARSYSVEEKLGQLSLVFTGIILLISALGLIGLSSFLAEQKTKEIGIRKVLGASVRHIIFNMTREYVWLIALSSVIAWLVAWIVMKNWLDHFAYQTTVGLHVYAGAALAALFLALLVTSLRAWRASGIDPAATLKYE